MAYGSLPWKKRCLGECKSELYRNSSLVERRKLIILVTQKSGTSTEIIKWQFVGIFFFSHSQW